ERQWQAQLSGLSHLTSPFLNQIGAGRQGFINNDPELLSSLQAEFPAAERSRQGKIVDILCSWPSPSASAVLQQMAREPWAQERAILNLTLRFGRPELVTWADRS